MIVLGAALVGILLGVLTAKKRGGKGLDMAQYGAAYGIAFAIVGLLATVMFHRMMV